MIRLTPAFTRLFRCPFTDLGKRWKKYDNANGKSRQKPSVRWSTSIKSATKSKSVSPKAKVLKRKSGKEEKIDPLLESLAAA